MSAAPRPVPEIVEDIEQALSSVHQCITCQGTGSTRARRLCDELLAAVRAERQPELDEMRRKYFALCAWARREDRDPWKLGDLAVRTIEAGGEP